MKRKALPMLSKNGQHALDQYRLVLRQREDLSPVTIRNYLSDLRQFIAWCECSWHIMLEEPIFTLQAGAPSLLIHDSEYPQTTLNLKPSMVNRTLMSLKRYFSLARKEQLAQSNPASPIKFVPKETAPPQHLSDEEEEALVATINDKLLVAELKQKQNLCRCSVDMMFA
jgi:site-specific recombinase XerD